ncbi:MAG: hypothetical protein ABIP39_11955 [Polyangiaceae bacterium]
MKLLALFCGASVSAVACASVLGVDDIPYTGALDATTTDGEGNDGGSTIDGEAGGSEANSCEPVVCATDGGEGGLQCGEGYSGCGSYFNCGTCTSGARSTCDFHLCACQPSTCVERAAACGSFSNECGGDLDCGLCGDASCQARDSGTFAFACVAGPCVPSASTCTGKCNDVTNNCGVIQHCGACSDHSFCGLSGATSCTCPARDKNLVENFFASYGTHCWGDCPAYYPAGGNVVAHLYASSTAALTPLFRCDYDNLMANPAHFLTTSPVCEGLNQAPAQTVGYCAPVSATPSCGAVHLHRYKNPSGNDHVVVLEGNAPASGYTVDEGPLCDAWLN